jgi:hypothetical protein
MPQVGPAKYQTMAVMMSPPPRTWYQVGSCLLIECSASRTTCSRALGAWRAVKLRVPGWPPTSREAHLFAPRYAQRRFFRSLGTACSSLQSPVQFDNRRVCGYPTRRFVFGSRTVAVRSCCKINRKASPVLCACNLEVNVDRVAIGEIGGSPKKEISNFEVSESHRYFRYSRSGKAALAFYAKRRGFYAECPPAP